MAPDFQILALIAMDGLTRTYYGEELISEIVSSSSDENHELYVIREFLTEKFPDLETTEKFWLNAQNTYKALEKNSEIQSLKYIKAEKRTHLDQTNFYMFFEYIPNLLTLKQWMDEKFTEIEYPITELINSIILPIAKNIEIAHKLGIVLRDLSPYTIYISQNEGIIRPIVASWRTAQFLTPDQIHYIPESINDLPNGEIPVLSPGFYAPEIAMGKLAIATTDIYEIGALLYFILTQGSHRFNDETAEDFILEPRIINQEIQEELNLIVQKATQFEPKERYQSISEFLRDLNSFLNEDFESLSYLFYNKDTTDVIGLLIKDNDREKESFIPFNLDQMTLEENCFFKFGKDFLEDSAFYPGIAKISNESEQFIIAYSQDNNLFYLYEGRNHNHTLLDGNQIEKEKWVDVQLNQKITIEDIPNFAITIESQEFKLFPEKIRENFINNPS